MANFTCKADDCKHYWQGSCCRDFEDVEVEVGFGGRSCGSLVCTGYETEETDEEEE